MKKLDLRILLKKREFLHEGGPGLSIFMNISLREIMIRWVSFMMEKATIKLNKIIEVLEKEV